MMWRVGKADGFITWNLINWMNISKSVYNPLKNTIPISQHFFLRKLFTMLIDQQQNQQLISLVQPVMIGHLTKVV